MKTPFIQFMTSKESAYIYAADLGIFCVLEEVLA